MSRPGGDGERRRTEFVMSAEQSKGEAVDLV